MSSSDDKRPDYRVRDLGEIFGIVKPRKDLTDEAEVKSYSLSGSFGAKRISRLHRRKSVEEILNIV